MATNTGQNVRYRILRILEDEGVQGWGDLRTHERLSRYSESLIQFELAKLVETRDVLDIGHGYKITPSGAKFLADRRMSSERKGRFGESFDAQVEFNRDSIGG